MPESGRAGERPAAALDALLFAPPNERARAAEIVAAEKGEKFAALLIETAYAMKVIPALKEALGETETVLSPFASRLLAARSLAATAHSTELAREAVRVITALDSAGIAVVAFKGIGVMANLYGSPAGRMVGDIDLLLPEDALERAGAVLVACGYQSPAGVGYAQYLEAMRHEIFATHLFCVFRSAGGVEVDLHWKINAPREARLDVTGVLDRARASPLLESRIPVAAPADAMLLTLHHIVRENFAPETSLKDLHDLAAWWDKPEEAWEVEEVANRARAAGLGESLLACWRIVAASGRSPRCAAAADRLAAALGRTSVEADRLLNLFEFQLARGSINPDLFKIVNPLSAWRFLAHRVSRPLLRRRLRQRAREKERVVSGLAHRAASALHTAVAIGWKELAACRTLVRQQNSLRRAKNPGSPAKDRRHSS